MKRNELVFQLKVCIFQTFTILKFLFCISQSYINIYIYISIIYIYILQFKMTAVNWLFERIKLLKVWYILSFLIWQIIKRKFYKKEILISKSDFLVKYNFRSSNAFSTYSNVFILADICDLLSSILIFFYHLIRGKYNRKNTYGNFRHFIFYSKFNQIFSHFLKSSFWI